ncbi:helix-turn-helix domain-containing protein [Streptomyces sp. NPDC051132]|uniref:helix-turn-helix transcriptional regulator n=1 Tax=unclassified Streptomyces TaxID=2593676 RepID=UPI00344A4E55
MSTRESPRRRALLDVLRAAPSPLGVAQAAERMGLHPNTVRFHLDALMADGLVEPRTEKPAGPGRPRTVYTARPGMDRGGPRDYRLLARMLLSRWAATAGPAEARAQARETGRAWGGFLADPPAPGGTPTPERSTAGLLGLLDGLGFAPHPEGGEPGGPPERIRLRHCPFLELAEEQGELVCALHLGLIQGALARLEAPLTVTALEPFAEPDSCVAHLSRTTVD